MMPTILKASIWAGIIALDFTGFGPWMASQPMVAGPLFGALLGHLSVGLILGGIVQLLWMDVTPVGVGIPYDATAATLLAVYWATLPTGQAGLPLHPALSQIVLALVLAVPFGFLFRMMDQYARRVNTHLAHWVENVPDKTLRPALALGIAGGLLWSWLRYAISYLVIFWVGTRIWNHIAYSPKMTWVDQGLTMAVILLPVAGMGVTLELFLSEEPEQRWASWRPFRGSKPKVERT